MKLLFIFALAASAVYPANIVINSRGADQTQVKLQYVATSPAACTISGTDNNGGPPIRDLDPALFPGANLDLSRTAAAGFDWPTLTSADGLTRTVFIGTHNVYKVGSDMKVYSTALQVASSHTFVLTCNNGADTGTITVSTSNEPLGNTYPEFPNAIIGGPLGGTPQPWVDWSRAGRNSWATTDPIKGTLIKRVTGGEDVLTDPPYFGSVIPLGCEVYDVSNAWTNPNNLVAGYGSCPGSSSAVATTSTKDAVIFVPFDPSFFPAILNYNIDFSVTLSGGAGSGTVTEETCISQDSGGTCSNYTPQNATFTTGTNTYGPFPSALTGWTGEFPSGGFASWGGMRTAFGSYNLLNRQIAGASASGNLVSLRPTFVYSDCSTVQACATYFTLDTPQGSIFNMSSCGSGSDTILHVDHVMDMNHIQTVENNLNLSNCTYTDRRGGLRIRLRTVGTLNVRINEAKTYVANGFTSGSNGDRYVCNKYHITDIVVDGQGVTHSPPIGGFLCMFSISSSTNIYTYLIDDNGNVSYQGGIYPSVAPGHAGAAYINWVDSHSYIVTDSSGANIYKATHIANNYQEIAVNNAGGNDNKYTYTALGSSQLSASKFTAACGSNPADDPRCISAHVATSGVLPLPGFQVSDDDGANPPNTIYQYISSQVGQDLPCWLAWTDTSFNLKTSIPPFGGYPIAYDVCHFSAILAGGNSLVSMESEGSAMGPEYYNSGVAFGGPYITQAVAIRKNGSFSTTTATLSGCTNASPVTCNLPLSFNIDNVTGKSGGSCAHCLGAYLIVSSATGGWTGFNGALYAQITSMGTNITVSFYHDVKGTSPVDSTLWGSFSTQTPMVSAVPPYYSIISTFTSNGGNVRGTANLADGGARGYFPGYATTGIQGIMFSGDPVTIVQAGPLNSTTQYYVKPVVSSTSLFDVCMDAACSSPASCSAFLSDTGIACGSGNSGYVVLAETCPDPATTTLPGPLYFDTGFGTSGHPKVRCLTTRVKHEMYSYWPGTTEANAFRPCQSAGNPYPGCSGAAAEASDTSLSMIHIINVGDGMMGLTHTGGNHEIQYTLKVDRSAGESLIDITTVRSWGDDPNLGWRGVTNGVTDTYSLNSGAGWTPIGTIIGPKYLVNFNTDPPTYVAPPLGSHGDLVRGLTPGHVTTVGCPNPSSHGCADDQVDVAPSALTPTYIGNYFPTWINNSYDWTSLLQSYPNKRTYPGIVSTANSGWKSDVTSPNIDTPHAGQNQPDIYAAVSSPLFSLGSDAYKITPLPSSSGVNIKVTPVLVFDSPQNYFTDISGPNSNILTAPDKSSCNSYQANECFSGSAVGDVSFKAKTLVAFHINGYDWCVVNSTGVTAPCALGVHPALDWALQVKQPATPDATGTQSRRLSQLFWPSLNQYAFLNWIASTDGNWGFFNPPAVQQQPLLGQDTAENYFRMKIPPFPTASDGVDRTGYVQKNVVIASGTTGDKIRIKFGRGENGDPASGRCLSRREACWTSSAATTTNPFDFDFESTAAGTSHKYACDAGCTVPVPTIPGSVTFYQIERTNGATTTILDCDPTSTGQKICAFIDTFNPSTVCDAPTFAPVPGTYMGAQNITLSATCTKICYRTDGGTPTATVPGTCDAGSTTYTSAINVASTETITGISTQASFVGSPIASGTYTIVNPMTCSTPAFSPAPTTYPVPQNITVTSNCATICYTVDGTVPTATTPGTCDHGATYSGGITVPMTETIRVLATQIVFINSVVANGAYIIASPFTSGIFGGQTKTGAAIDK